MAESASTSASHGSGHAGPVGAALGVRPGYGLGYTGSGTEYFVIQLVNGLLILVTLGLYYPWARVRELNFMIGSLTAGGDSFSFHGQGRELFWGVLRAWLLFVLPLILLGFGLSTPSLDAGTRMFFFVAFYFLGFVFVCFALMGSLRYRASRTSWHGIRFGFDGRFSEFGAAYGLRLLLVLVSLGIAYPFASTWRRDYVITHSRFGAERMGFDGSPSELFGVYVLCWFLLIPTLGFSMVWFHGHQQAYFWNHTTLAGGRFYSSLTGGEWVGISFINSLLVTFTLGFGASWAYTNLHREFFSRLTLRDADLGKVEAAASTGSAMGEGAADVLDVDGGIDI